MKSSAILEKIISIATNNGWSVNTNNFKNKCVQFEFSQFTPAGQDFNFCATLRENDPQILVENIKEYYYDYDSDAEAYLWIGEDGHGKNGAPYYIKDIVDDMEAAKEMIYQLYIELDKAF